MFNIDYKIPKYLHKLRDHLFDEYVLWLIDHCLIGMTDHKKDLAKKSVCCVLLNINNTIKSNKKGLVITLDENSYKHSKIINGKNTKRKVSYTYTRKFIDFLEMYDYASLTLGGDPVKFGFVNGKWGALEFTRTTLSINNKLQQLYNKLVKSRSGYDRLENLVILRSKNSKSEKEFKMNTHIKAIYDFLYNYNTFSEDVEFIVCGQHIDVQIYKIFNEDFNKGGRSQMVSDYQRLTSEERKDASLAGKDIVCYDYVAFEPSIVYSMNQEVMEMDDPYVIPSLLELGYSEDIARKLCKLVILISLNVESRNDAKLAINKSISENMNVTKLYESGEIPNKLIPVSVILDHVIEYHHMIADAFFSAKGLVVQNVGSAINDYILDYMLQHHKQLVVQTHDEFIVNEDYEEELKETMFRAYEYVLGFSDNCKIKKEK